MSGVQFSQDYLPMTVCKMFVVLSKFTISFSTNLWYSTACFLWITLSEAILFYSVSRCHCSFLIRERTFKIVTLYQCHHVLDWNRSIFTHDRHKFSLRAFVCSRMHQGGCQQSANKLSLYFKAVCNQTRTCNTTPVNSFQGLHTLPRLQLEGRERERGCRNCRVYVHVYFVCVCTCLCELLCVCFFG